MATSAPASKASIAARIPAQPAPTTSTSCLASTRVTLPDRPPTVVRRANYARPKTRAALVAAVIGTVHVGPRSAARAGPGAEPPALRRRRGQPHRGERRERRRAVRPTGDSGAGAPHGAASGDGDGEPEDRRSEERRHRRARGDRRPRTSRRRLHAPPQRTSFAPGRGTALKAESRRRVPGGRAALRAVEAGDVGRHSAGSR